MIYLKLVFVLILFFSFQQAFCCSDQPFPARSALSPEKMYESVFQKWMTKIRKIPGSTQRLPVENPNIRSYLNEKIICSKQNLTIQFKPENLRISKKYSVIFLCDKVPVNKITFIIKGSKRNFTLEDFMSDKWYNLNEVKSLKISVAVDSNIEFSYVEETRATTTKLNWTSAGRLRYSVSIVEDEFQNELRRRYRVFFETDKLKNFIGNYSVFSDPVDKNLYCYRFYVGTQEVGADKLQQDLTDETLDTLGKF